MPRVRPDPLTLAAGIVTAAAAAWQLLVPPIVGLANNGDFERVMGPAGFRYLIDDPGEKYFSWIVTRFSFAPPGWFRSGLLTSETLVARLARLVSEPFSGVFDLRVLGSIHAALLVAGLGLLVSATRPLPRAARWTAAALLVFFFTDVGYVAPLNSFYSQAASLVFLLLTLGVAARSIGLRERGTGHAVAFFVAAALFAGSKPQEAVQGLLLAAFGLLLYRQPGRLGLIRQPAALAALALAAFSLWYLRSTPPSISEIAKYHKVFMELLPNSPSPERDLEDLGLDPAWVSASGRIAYKPTSPYADPVFRAEFLGRFSYARLARFYGTHPDRLAATLGRGGREALRLRHSRFGNLEHGPGVAPGEKSGAFSLWSGLRVSLPGHPLRWLVPFLAGNLLLALATRRRASGEGRMARDGIVLLVAMAVVAFLVCVLSNAHGDLPRHFYVFHALVDLLLASDLTWAAAVFARH